MTRNTGRAQCAHTADPCNKVHPDATSAEVPLPTCIPKYDLRSIDRRIRTKRTAHDLFQLVRAGEGQVLAPGRWVSTLPCHADQKASEWALLRAP